MFRGHYICSYFPCTQKLILSRNGVSLSKKTQEFIHGAVVVSVQRSKFARYLNWVLQHGRSWHKGPEPKRNEFSKLTFNNSHSQLLLLQPSVRAAAIFSFELEAITNLGQRSSAVEQKLTRARRSNCDALNFAQLAPTHKTGCKCAEKVDSHASYVLRCSNQVAACCALQVQVNKRVAFTVVSWKLSCTKSCNNFYVYTKSEARWLAASRNHARLIRHSTLDFLPSCSWKIPCFLGRPPLTRSLRCKVAPDPRRLSCGNPLICGGFSVESDLFRFSRLRSFNARG